MGGGALSRFAGRLQRRIKLSGFSNISVLLKQLGYSGALLASAKSGGQSDLGLMKITRVATILGVYPSEMVRDLDAAIDNPPMLAPEDCQRLGIQGYPERFDRTRFDVICDVVLDWVLERGIREPDHDIGAQCVDLYDGIVRADPTIELIRLRQRVLAILADIELPAPAPAKRRSG